MISRMKHRDSKNAQSILDAAEREMQFTLKQPVSEESSFNIIRNIYECFRMLGDAILVSRGIVSQDHVEQIRELELIQVETKRPIKLIDSLRKLRHNINYYGFNPRKTDSDDAISFARTCFSKFAEGIKKLVQ